MSATSVIRCVGILSGILEDAVDARRVHQNVARRMKNLPKKSRRTHRYLTHEQVAAFATAAGQYRLTVLIGCYLGLRWGEITGLQVRDFDPLRKRLHVRRNVVLVGRKFHEGTPKSNEVRSVPVPKFLISEIQNHIYGKGPLELFFHGESCEYIYRPRGDMGWFKAAKVAIGLKGPFTPHDMRHTAASLAVQAGAHVKAVQRMLGHTSAAMTLDVYADLFDTDLDQVAEALDAARSKVA